MIIIRIIDPGQERITLTAFCNQQKDFILVGKSQWGEVTSWNLGTARPAPQAFRRICTILVLG